MDTKQRALAAEIRAEMARHDPPVRASAVQKALGVSSTAWGTWFVQCTRDVPMGVVLGVADYLGVQASDLLRRAEERPGTEKPSGADRRRAKAAEKGKTVLEAETPGVTKRAAKGSAARTKRKGA